jgi:hypothetical protein
MTVPTLRIRDRLPQVLQIVASGNDIARIAPEQPLGEYDEDIIPDVVARWVQAVNVGLLGSAVAAPERCAAELIESARAPNGEQTWLVRVELADRGALRILANLLAARDLDAVTFTTARQAGVDWEKVPSLNIGMLAYPRAARASFTVDRAQVPSAGKNRGVQVVFATPPADDAVDALIAALDLWAELILWGGYALEGQDPRRSGALPDGALLYDPTTVTQTFTQAFDCDDAAFEAVVSLAAGLAARGTPISRVEVR